MREDLTKVDVLMYYWIYYLKTILGKTKMLGYAIDFLLFNNTGAQMWESIYYIWH